MSRYDAWLEAPYQRRAAREERLESLEDELWDWPFEDWETCLDGAVVRDKAWAIFNNIDRRQEPWNKLNVTDPFFEVMERANDEEAALLRELHQQAAEDYDQYLDREGPY